MLCYTICVCHIVEMIHVLHHMLHVAAEHPCNNTLIQNIVRCCTCNCIYTLACIHLHTSQCIGIQVAARHQGNVLAPQTEMKTILIPNSTLYIDTVVKLPIGAVPLQC